MKKKLLIFCSLLVINLISIPVASNAAEPKESQDSLMLFTKDLKTGEIGQLKINDLSNYAQGDAPSFAGNCNDGVMPYSIIGSEDTRVRVPDMIMNYSPYSCIGVVIASFSDGSSSQGTGFLYSSNDVATAGHVLYKTDKNIIATSVRFYPGTNGALSTGYSGSTFAVPAEYMNTGNNAYDWATFALGSDIGDSVGYMGWTSTVNVNDTVQVTGYPSDKQPPYEMWMAGSQVNIVTEHTIGYYVDTYSGQSGSPAYLGTTQQVVAIHVAGGSINNYGKKVDNTLASVFTYGRNH